MNSHGEFERQNHYISSRPFLHLFENLIDPLVGGTDGYGLFERAWQANEHTSALREFPPQREKDRALLHLPFSPY
jgi:hypothetical protein